MLEHSCLPNPLVKYTEEQLYNYYVKNMASKDIRYCGNQIHFFDTPVIDGHEQGFHHISTKTDKKLKMRFLEERAYYINWVIPIIENASLCSNCDNMDCSKIYVWDGIKKGIKRKKFLVEEKNVAYLIILEQKREKRNRWYIITAFLINKQNKNDIHYLSDILEEYHNFAQKKDRKTIFSNG